MPAPRTRIYSSEPEFRSRGSNASRKRLRERTRRSDSRGPPPALGRSNLTWLRLLGAPLQPSDAPARQSRSGHTARSAPLQPAQISNSPRRRHGQRPPPLAAGRRAGRCAAGRAGGLRSLGGTWAEESGAEPCWSHKRRFLPIKHGSLAGKGQAERAQ